MESVPINKYRLKDARDKLLALNKLTHAAIAAIDILDSQTCFSPNDLRLLEQIEQRFQVKNESN